MTQCLKEYLKIAPEHSPGYMSDLHEQSRVLHKPLSLIIGFCWVSYMMGIDFELHPEFPGLFYFRLTVTVIGLSAFLISFVDRLRGKGIGR